MRDSKDKLRNQLFEMYFENKDGIMLCDLMNQLSVFINKFKELKELLYENINSFGPYGYLYSLKFINYNNVSYLFLKVGMWRYLIIDLSNVKVLNKSEVKEIFDEDFFIKNLNECEEALSDGIDGLSFTEYKGNLVDFLYFCLKNKQYLDIDSEILYENYMGDAFTYISINIYNDRVCLGFRTSDQFLYEHLSMYGDLTPFGLQDAQDKIGIEKMKEFFERIKSIIIPNLLIDNVILNDIQESTLDGVKLVKSNNNL